MNVYLLIEAADKNSWSAGEVDEVAIVSEERYAKEWVAKSPGTREFLIFELDKKPV